MTHNLHYSRNDFKLGYLCNSLAENGVLEENLISFTEEAGLAKGSRPGTAKYLFSRSLKHVGTVAGLGLAGLLFAFVSDLTDGNINLPLNFYGISYLFGVVAGYCDWYSEYDNHSLHEVESPKKKANEFRSKLYTRYYDEISDILKKEEVGREEEKLQKLQVLMMLQSEGVSQSF